MIAAMYKRLLILICSVFLVGPFVLISRQNAVVEPQRNGRTVTEWIKALGTSASQDEARTNLTELGLSAVPYIVLAIRQGDGLATKAQIKVTGISWRMRKFLGEPFPWKYVREDLVVILGAIGKARYERNPDDTATASEMALAVATLITALKDEDANLRSLCVRAVF